MRIPEGWNAVLRIMRRVPRGIDGLDFICIIPVPLVAGVVLGAGLSQSSEFVCSWLGWVG